MMTEKKGDSHNVRRCCCVSGGKVREEVKEKEGERENEAKVRGDEDWGERNERKGAKDRVKTGADEDGEIETESNVEIIGETLRVTEAAAHQTETAA